MQTTDSKLDATLLMPVYSGTNAEHLHLAIKSIIWQSVRIREYLFVVDGPVDDGILATLDMARVCLKHENVKLIKLEKNEGLGSALMQGVNHASGKFIIRMDDDDVSLPERFSRIAGLIKENPTADVIGAQIIEFNDRKQFRQRKVPLSNHNILKQLAYRNAINHVTICAKKNSLVCAGNYSSSKSAGFEDYILWQRMKKNGAVFINDYHTHVLVRFDEKQITSRSGIQYFKDELKLFSWFREQNMITLAQFILAVIIRLCARLLPKAYLSLIYTYLLRTKIKEATFYSKILSQLNHTKLS